MSPRIGKCNRFSGPKDPHIDYITKSNGDFKFAAEEFYPELIHDAGESTTLMKTPLEKVIFFDAEYTSNLTFGTQAYPANAISKIAFVDGNGRALLKTPCHRRL